MSVRTVTKTYYTRLTACCVFQTCMYILCALTNVVIDFSPPLAYCTIFIVMSSEVVDLHICICIRTSHCLYRVRIGCAPQQRCRGLYYAAADPVFR